MSGLSVFSVLSVLSILSVLSVLSFQSLLNFLCKSVKVIFCKTVKVIFFARSEFTFKKFAQSYALKLLKKTNKI